MQKGFAPILILVGVLLITIIAGGAYYLGTSKAIITQPQNTAVSPQTPQPVSTPSVTQNPTQTTTPKPTVTPVSSPTIKASPTPTLNQTLSPSPNLQINQEVQSNITVTVKGEVYADSNCNGAVDGNEGGVANVTVNIFQTDGADTNYLLSTIATDSSGHYSYSDQIPINNHIWIRPSAVAPEGYKIYYSTGPTALLNKNTLAWPDINLPIISINSLGNCNL